MKEIVKPVTLEKAWKSLLQQLTGNRNLCLPIFDWYRGQLHFQDWYRLVVACTPADWNVHFHASRVHKLQPAVTVPAALRLVDSWMKINRQGQPLARPIWKDLETICPPQTLQEEEPTIGRMIRYKDQGLRPEYSSFISYSEEDFLQVQGNLVLAMPADLNPRSAMAQAILREYDKEKIFRLRPKVGSVIHVGAAITGSPEISVWLLIVRSSSKQAIMMEDLYSALQEVAQRFSKHRQGVLHFPMLDTERGVNHLGNLYAMLDEVFYQSSVRIVLHDRVFVTIGCVHEEIGETP